MGDAPLRLDLPRLPAVPAVPGPLSRGAGREPRALLRPGPWCRGMPRQMGGAGLPVPCRCGPRKRKNIPPAPAPAPSPHDWGQAGGNQIAPNLRSPLAGTRPPLSPGPAVSPGRSGGTQRPPGALGAGIGAPRGAPGGADGGLRFQRRNPTRARPRGTCRRAASEATPPPGARARPVDTPPALVTPLPAATPPNRLWACLSRDVTVAPPALPLTSPRGRLKVTVVGPGPGAGGPRHGRQAAAGAAAPARRLLLGERGRGGECRDHVGRVPVFPVSPVLNPCVPADGAQEDAVRVAAG